MAHEKIRIIYLEEKLSIIAVKKGIWYAFMLYLLQPSIYNAHRSYLCTVLQGQKRIDKMGL